MPSWPDPMVTRFIKEARRYPVLTADRERQLAAAWRARRDPAARDELVGSHLRLVVKIARGFAGYGQPLSDLVAEGNLGLLQAVEKFDLERGVRFATYAAWWIRASVQDYVVRSSSLVRMGTTAAQRKLFFNLRRLKTQLAEFETGDLAPAAVARIAKDLRVPESTVVEMNRRLATADASLNSSIRESDPEWLEQLPDDHPSQEAIVGQIEEDEKRRELLRLALTALKPRERDIVSERRLTEKPATLNELSRRYATSIERIRQIEVRAMEKMTCSILADAKDGSPLARDGRAPSRRPPVPEAVRPEVAR